MDPDGEIVPTRVTGSIDGGRRRALRDLAVAVNGRIRATGRSFRLRGKPAEFFSMLVPEDVAAAGRNEVELLRGRVPDGRLAPL